jgi:type IV fimbrial biogenesis protein FimT
MGKRSGCTGITLLELLVVCDIVGILQALAVPSFMGMLKAARLNSSTAAFFGSIHLARSEAVKRNARVVLCKSAAGSSCDSTDAWEQGWIVFHDANNNAALDEGEAIILRQQALQAVVRISGGCCQLSWLVEAGNEFEWLSG